MKVETKEQWVVIEGTYPFNMALLEDEDYNTEYYDSYEEALKSCKSWECETAYIICLTNFNKSVKYELDKSTVASN